MHRRFTSRSLPTPRALLIVVILVSGLLSARIGLSQVASSPDLQDGLRLRSPLDDPFGTDDTPTDTASSTRESLRASDNTSLRDDPMATPQESLSMTLTTNQIIRLIQERPEVAVDLKHLMAEYFLKRRISVQEDSITDEILFSNLASNPALRHSVSVWLRARGYVDGAAFDEAEGLQQQLQPAAGLQPEASPPGSSMAPESRNAARMLFDLPDDSELVPEDPSATPLMRSDLQSTEAPVLSTPSDSKPVQRRPETDPDKKPLARKEQEPALLHRPAPYNLQSLRDLYTQLPEETEKLTTFGSDLFTPRGPVARQAPIDLPIGPDYVLGPGDTLTVSLWGGVTQSVTRVVTPDGAVVLPEAGPVQVAGLTLGHAETIIQNTLARQFREARVVVSIARLRTIRVYVLGDVLRPGAYDITSLSTPLNALYAAGGPTKSGSMRAIRHMRGHSLICEVDLYDFLRKGVDAGAERLQAGDTILVPPVGAVAQVAGMVKRPAVYEFKQPSTLAEIIDNAGGLKPEAAIGHIRIERIDAAGHRATTEIDLPANVANASARQQMESFAIRDGDRIVVAPVLPYSERVIYTSGHFARPGRMPFHDEMTLANVIRSSTDLLPEPSSIGEIIRLVPPDLHPEAVQFSVSEVLAGSAAPRLQPFDTILVRGRYEADAPRVTIRGEVLKPGAYALTEGMTAAQLVRIAGGFKRSALLQDADLASYEVREGTHIVGQRRTVAIGEAVLHEDRAADVVLMPGDVLTVHQISGWNDIGASVTLTGEVVYPGTYGLQEGETLSSVIRRAGGFRTTAYPEGAIMVRQQVKQLELKSRAELIRQIETTSAGARVGSSATGGDENGTLQLVIQQQNQILQRLRAEPVVGRLVINISSDIDRWQKTPADIQMRAGDAINIPKRPGFVLVTGQAYNTSAISFEPGKNAGWYLRHAGGATDMAARKEIFVVRANGLVIGRRSGDWNENVLSTRMDPGDVVVVPQKIVGGSVVWKNTLAAAQVVSSIAFTAALALK